MCSLLGGGGVINLLLSWNTKVQHLWCILQLFAFSVFALRVQFFRECANEWKLSQDVVTSDGDLIKEWKKLFCVIVNKHCQSQVGMFFFSWTWQ